MKTVPDRPPKILPWLARKAGIPVELAEALWRQATQEAGHRHARGSSAYWKMSTDGLLEKIAAESVTRRNAPFGFGIWLRLPVRLWLHGINFTEALALDAARRWRGATC
jgi:hypothetical protein